MEYYTRETLEIEEDNFPKESTEVRIMNKKANKKKIINNFKGYNNSQYSEDFLKHANIFNDFLRDKQSFSPEYFLEDIINPNTKQIIKDDAFRVILLEYNGVKMICKVSSENNEGSNSHIAYGEILNSLYVNQLKKDIPNFPFMYGYYDAKGPNTTSIIPYYFYEYIEDSYSFIDFLELVDNDHDIINIVVILCLSLREATVSINFTHHDLHKDNILIKVLNEREKLSCNTKNGKYNVVTKYMPYIIDYGLSCVKNKYIVGSNYYENFVREKSNIIYDYHKLIYCVIIGGLASTVEKSDKYFDLICYLHNFFHKDYDVANFLNNKGVYIKETFLYGLPKHPTIDQIELADQFIEYLLNY